MDNKAMMEAMMMAKDKAMKGMPQDMPMKKQDAKNTKGGKGKKKPKKGKGKAC